jgi:hypothetical protein
MQQQSDCSSSYEDLFTFGRRGTGLEFSAVPDSVTDILQADVADESSARLLGAQDVTD